MSDKNREKKHCGLRWPAVNNSTHNNPTIKGQNWKRLAARGGTSRDETGEAVNPSLWW
jgi:hypothetical protein